MKKEALDLFPEGKLDITLMRLAHQLIENHGDFQDTVFLGIQPRGVFLGRRIVTILEAIIPGSRLYYGDLDTTFFRDDFRRRDNPIHPNQTRIDFLIEKKHVILIDDVLYTGRTVRAAMDAMLAYGRPLSVELLVLVDRVRNREVPIQPSYVGIKVDTIETERVKVILKERGGTGTDEVILVSPPQE